jgi:two-component system chemotaxis response regulator CheY
VKILVADDDPTSRLIARLALEDLGHECVVVGDGESAWQAFRTDRPDVTISDWMMPGMTGVELCRHIRAVPDGASTYFILVTSRGEREQVIEGMNAGADDYLVKPLNIDELQFRLIAAARVTALHRQLELQRIGLEGRNHDLTTIARRDPLTDLYNRRALEEDLVVLEARVQRYQHRYCLALFDVDQFKAYNDTQGHQMGDLVLQAVAGQLRTQARGGDSLYRYGGEEFLCIFPEQALEAGVIAAERMRRGIQALAIPHPSGFSSVLTVSCGVAVLDPDERRTSDAVLKESDEALYLAKQLGRNRVEHLAPAHG